MEHFLKENAAIANFIHCFFLRTTKTFIAFLISYTTLKIYKLDLLGGCEEKSRTTNTRIRPNKIIPLFPEKRVMKKKPTREAGKTFFLYFNPEKFPSDSDASIFKFVQDVSRMLKTNKLAGKRLL